MSDPYYRADLALVHHLGFGSHAVTCAPGILDLLRPVADRGGTVMEIGCGSGLLTKELIGAGHRVVATDASPAMLALAREVLGDGADLRRITLPDDPLPEVDAIVSVGHAISYLDDEESVDRALAAMAEALRPGGVLAVDVCDLEWGEARRGEPNLGLTAPDWALVTEFSQPSPDRYVRDMTTFVLDPHGAWRRDVERHENVLVDTGRLPVLLAGHGVEAVVRPSFGAEHLPRGLKALIGTRTV